MLEELAKWVADPACAGNAMTLTVAGIIYSSEGNYVEALKACHTGLSLEMYVYPLRRLTTLTRSLDHALGIRMQVLDNGALSNA